MRRRSKKSKNNKKVIISHRIAPKPENYELKEKGTCRYCDKHIYKDNGELNMRKLWHSECFEEYKLIYWPKETRKAVFKRDKGICSKCDKEHSSIKGWELDHIKPLIESNGNIEYWKLDNIQTLCENCHTQKTSLENSERAFKKRSEKILDVKDAFLELEKKIKKNEKN